MELGANLPGELVFYQNLLNPTMIIPVRCFTCGKVCSFSDYFIVAKFTLNSESVNNNCNNMQVIGQKWDAYLDLLQVGYSEG